MGYNPRDIDKILMELPEGIDNAGRKVASGVYFYKFDTNNYHKINKMLLIK